MEAIAIHSREDERILAYLSLRKSSLIEHYGENYFLAETYKVVRPLLRSGLELVSLLSTREYLEEFSKENLLRNIPKQKIFCAPKKVMESIVGFNLHQGLMAIAKRPLDTSLEDLDSKIIVFNHVNNPENVGSIVRSGFGLGFSSYLVDKQSTDPYLRRSVRVSMGHIFSCKVHRTSALTDSLSTLKKRGYQILGSQIAKDTTPLSKHCFSSKIALIIGNEVHGMGEEVLKYCDKKLQIPSAVGNYAFNASHAAAILCYAASLEENN